MQLIMQACLGADFAGAATSWPWNFFPILGLAATIGQWLATNALGYTGSVYCQTAKSLSRISQSGLFNLYNVSGYVET